MKKYMLLLTGLMFFCLSACDRKADHLKNATQEDLSVKCASKYVALVEASLPLEVKDAINVEINHRREIVKYYDSGIAIGILVDNTVVYTKFLGTTRMDGAGTPITRHTKFNVNPGNPFKLSTEFGVFSPECFKRAGVNGVATQADELFAHPHVGYFLSTNNNDDKSYKMLSFEEVATKGDLWASMDDVMHYLASHQPLDGFSELRMDNFEEQILEKIMYGNGYTVSISAVPSKKMYIVILENSIDKGTDDYSTSILAELIPHNMDADTDMVDAKPLERYIYYALDKDENTRLVARYQCGEGYRNFQIVWKDENFILETDQWHSRISGLDTYEAGQESVDDEGELKIEDAMVSYRLLDAPIPNMVLVPEFDNNKKIQSLTVGEIVYEYERLGDTYYESRTIRDYTTCKPVP